MAKEKVERFEDLIAWQKARELTKAIYLLTREGEFFKDFGLREQIRRAHCAPPRESNRPRVPSRAPVLFRDHRHVYPAAYPQADRLLSHMAVAVRRRQRDGVQPCG